MYLVQLWVGNISLYKGDSDVAPKKKRKMRGGRARKKRERGEAKNQETLMVKGFR